MDPQVPPPSNDPSPSVKAEDADSAHTGVKTRGWIYRKLITVPLKQQNCLIIILFNCLLLYRLNGFLFRTTQITPMASW